MPCGEGRGRRLCQAHDCLGEYKWYLRGLGPEQRRVGGGRLFLVQNNPSTGLCWVWRPSSIRERLSLEGSAGDAFFWSRIQVHIPLQCGDCISAPLRVFIGALKPGGGGRWRDLSSGHRSRAGQCPVQGSPLKWHQDRARPGSSQKPLRFPESLPVSTGAEEPPRTPKAISKILSPVPLTFHHPRPHPGGEATSVLKAGG